MMKHKNYDIIVAWAKGKPIQFQPILGGGWVDFNSTIIPDFNSMFIEWRIKPEIPFRKYRVALLKDEDFYYTASNDGCDNEDFEESVFFVKWLTDWIFYEIE
jgi:hypothetical protein